jgi:hypothetical protein
MISTYELELFAKQAATNYLKDGKSLNDSITKLASDNALNHEQIARVVEAANTDVYINLFNKNKDKYVQFETANPEVIEESLIPVKTAEVISDRDYYDAPAYEVPENVEIFEKVAEKVPKERSQDELLRDYYQFKAAEAQLNNLLIEGQTTFEKEAGVLKEMIKQAVLGGDTPYSEISAALNTTTEPVFVETLKIIETELTPVMPLGSLTKVATPILGSLNTKHPLMQQSFKLVKIASEYRTLQGKLTELFADWEFYKQGGAKKSMVEQIAKSPGTFIAGLGLGTLGTALVIPTVAKERLKQEHNVLSNIPERYRG